VTAYQRGGYYEQLCADYLRSEGYFCWQSRGSRGPADVIALKPRQVLLVQVKGGRKTMPGGDWNTLLTLAQEAGAVPVVADWPRRGRMRLREITGRHALGSRDWPCVPFLVDEIAEGGTRRGVVQGR
jgi:Holliday junction resolvase